MTYRPRPWRRGLVPVAVAVALTLLAVPVQPAAAASGGGIGVALLDGPASQADNPRAQLYIIDQVPAGTTLIRHVRVSNSTDRAQTLTLYPAAAAISDGAFQFGAGHASSELTGWIRLQPSSVKLAGSSSSVVTATITVPATAAASERYAVLWAQAVAAGAVREVNRVGIRVYLDVSSTAGRTGFTIRSLRAGRGADGHSALTASVANTGTRALDLTGQLVLRHGPGGATAGPFPAGATTIGPGQTAAVPVPTGRDLTGPWTATLSLTSGITTRSATATITFPSKGVSGQAVAIATGGYRPGPPWWLWLIIAAGLATAARKLGRSRRPKHRRQPAMARQHGR